MGVSCLRPLVVAAFVSLAPAFAPAAAHAQQRPTPEQAQRLLQTRPDLVQRLRQQIQMSGLTPDQIRARLRAEGYPESLLDAYLPGGTGVASDSLPDTDVLRAARALGIADSTTLFAADSIPRSTNGGPRSRLAEDSLAADSTGADTLAVDSLGLPVRRRAARAAASQVFGLDVFRRASNQFEPNLAGPVDANYKLGPGDQLVLILTGDVELARTLDVTREGFVVIPQVGQLYVNNLTLGDLENLLYQRLGRVYSGVRRGAGATTHFSVSVAKLRANQVFVVGDAMKPGSYRISSAGTALTALYAAGGPTEQGSLRRIDIRRGGRTVQTLDVYDYLLRGDASRDVRLETGDVVFVAVHGPRVRVTGEVIRPADYELLPNETLADVIRMAGGFAPTASRRRVQIERIAPPTERDGGGGRDRFVVDVASESFAFDSAPPMRLEPGDIVRVFPVSERVRGRVVVRGNVWSEGLQGFTAGMRLSDALRAAGGVKPDTYLGEVLISRLEPDSTRSQFRATLRDTTGAVINDLTLREDDEVRVFAMSEFRPVRYVAITGAVRKPGRYPYRAGLTVRDLVLIAGGVSESAYLREAEIARLPEDRVAGTTAITMRVPLDSSYLVDRDPNGGYRGTPGIVTGRAGSAPEHVLRPYDNVLILQQPNWQLQRTVAVVGEVQFPGVYSLRSRQERLADVLRRAGGLTTEGYADGMQFYRKRGNVGRIGINLPKVLKQNRDRDNLLLEDGDSVVVPRFVPVVNVSGAVNSPVAVAYVPGANLDYYIARAGGYSRLADGKRSFVQQPNGSVESRSRFLLVYQRTPVPKPGGSVVVPARDPNEKKDYTAMAGAVAQVLASIVAIIAIAAR
jgi:polysaccharide biosynthesis/export protein